MSRRHRRQRALPAIVIIVAILVGTGLATAIVYNSLRTQAAELQTQLTFHLVTGQAELEAAKASLAAANANHDDAMVSAARVHFTTAKLQFAVAKQMADSSQLLRQVQQFPSVGDLATSRHVAVDGIADMGVAISDAGLELAQLDGLLIKPASAGGQQGRTLLTVLNQASSSLVIVRKDLDLAQKAAAHVDLGVLPPAQRAAFVRAKGTITSAIAADDEFTRLVPILTEVLGGNGKRTYLVEQVNPSELRPGGGFIGTYSALQANQGALKLLASGTAVDLVPGFNTNTRPGPGSPGYVTPPGPIREFIPGLSWSFIDSNFFPDFPSNALAGERFAEPYLGHIDGVISIDYYAVARMLDLTGPMPVPGYAITVTSANFVPLVVQYDLQNSPIRKAILSATAGPLMSRLTSLPPSQWPALIAVLNDLSSSRHLQTYFNNASVESLVTQFGWSATINPAGAQDYMMEIEANLGGTKANYFVVRKYTVELTRSGAVLHHKVIIDLTDNMPFYYRPGEYYRAYLRLYVSATASSPGDNLRRVAYPNPAPPSGTKMIDGWVPTFHGYGHSAQAVFSYDTPWVADGRDEGQIYWQKQPGTVADAVTVKWNDGNGHAYTTSGDLSQDRVITFSARGVSLTTGQPARAHLPSLGLG